MNKYAKGALVVGGVAAGLYGIVLAGRAVNSALRNMQMQNALQMQSFQAQQEHRYGRNSTQKDAAFWTDFAFSMANSLYSFGSRIYGDFFSGGGGASTGNASEANASTNVDEFNLAGGLTYDWDL